MSKAATSLKVHLHPFHNQRNVRRESQNKIDGLLMRFMSVSDAFELFTNRLHVNTGLRTCFLLPYISQQNGRYSLTCLTRSSPLTTR